MYRVASKIPDEMNSNNVIMIRNVNWAQLNEDAPVIMYIEDTPRTNIIVSFSLTCVTSFIVVLVGMFVYRLYRRKG